MTGSNAEIPVLVRSEASYSEGVSQDNMVDCGMVFFQIRNDSEVN